MKIKRIDVNKIKRNRADKGLSNKSEITLTDIKVVEGLYDDMYLELSDGMLCELVDYDSSLSLANGVVLNMKSGTLSAV